MRVLSPASIPLLYYASELPRSAKYILNSPILSTSCPYLLMYEIMDPIWILKIKMSDSVRGRGCSHLERQSKKVRTVGERVEQEGKKKMENLRQRKKRGYIVTRSRMLLDANESIRHRCGILRVPQSFFHIIYTYLPFN